MPLSADAARALARLSDVATRHALVTFRPSPVFAGLATETARKVLIRAANRVGKTRHCAWLVAREMVAKPGFRARVVGPTSDHVHRVLGEYLAQFLEPYTTERSYYVPGSGWNGGRGRAILLANGSSCELRSLRDDPEAHSGQSLDLVVFDEPPSFAHYLENAARLVDREGRLIIAATMVNRPVAWLRELVEGDEPSPGPGRTEHRTGWVQIVAAFRRENCPWYREEQIAEWVATMEASPWQFEQRVRGGWEGIEEDRLYRGLSESNVTPTIPGGGYDVGLVADWGTGVGATHVLLAYVAKRGRHAGKCWIVDEYVNDEPATPEIIAAGVVRMLKRNALTPGKVDFGLGDTSHTLARGTAGGWAAYSINDAVALELGKLTPQRRAPFVWGIPSKHMGSVDWGNRVLNFALMRNDLYLNPKARRTITSLKHWKGTKGPGDIEWSHGADAVRYLAQKVFGFRDDYAAVHFD